jgi:hypothetical protein
MVAKERWKLYLDFTSNKNDFYQNKIIKEFFNDMIKEKSEDELNEIEKDYYLFVDRFQNYINTKNSTQVYRGMALVMPYKIVVPYGENLLEYLWYKKKFIWDGRNDDIIPMEIQCSEDGYFDVTYSLDGEELDMLEWNIVNYDDEKIDINELPKSKFYT